MSYQVLARTWRPRSFTAMVGQAHVIKILRHALEAGRLHHAYLFTGTRGVGKTTLARVLAKCMNCEQGVSPSPCDECGACREIDAGCFVDLIEVDAASRARVEETRELMDNVQYRPTSGRFKVYLIDEVHMFSNHSFNALLKTLEEPPPHVKFLLATTEHKKVPVTVLSRCMQLNLHHLGTEPIAAQLRAIMDAESISSDDASLHLLAEAARGSMRDALSLLDQAIAHGEGTLESSQIRRMLGTIGHDQLRLLVQALIDRDGVALLQATASMRDFVPDYFAVLAELQSLFQKAAMGQLVPAQLAVFDKHDPLVRQLAETLDKETVQLYYQLCLKGYQDLAVVPDPAAGFEMILVRLLAFRPESCPATRTHDVKGPISSTPSSEDARSRLEEAVDVGTTQRKEPEPPVAPDPDADPARERWMTLIDTLGLRGLTRELASHCVPGEWTDQQLCLLHLPAHASMVKSRGGASLKEVLKKHLGDAVKIGFTAVPGISGMTPAQRTEKMSRQRHREELQAFRDDSFVRSLEDIFDGTVEDQSFRAAEGGKTHE